MKKLGFLFLVVLAGVFVLSYLRNLSDLRYLSLEHQGAGQETKKTILRAALIADSHNENGLLEKALSQAKGKGVNFVIGLGDYTNLGTIDELNKARDTFEASKLDYYVTAGDRDGWESRKLGNVNNFESVFGKSTQVFEKEGIRFVLLDNSEIYTGISQDDWELLDKSITGNKGTTSTTGYNSTRDTSDTLDSRGTLTFVFVHKTPFHPESAHVMGEDSEQVAEQAKDFMQLMEKPHLCHSDPESEFRTKSKILNQVQDDNNCPNVDGLFSGDLHFFAEFSSRGGSTDSGNSPTGSVKMTTVGAVSAERNFQGSRFGILTVFDDYSWEVEDVEIR